MIFPLITESYHPEAVIIAGGDYPTHPIPLALLRHAKFVCCCDGTAQTYIEHGYIPHAIVGDGDSLTEEFKTKYQSIFHHISEQEDNDLTKATRYCMAKGYTSICYLGATGKREDHTLGNISLLIRYMHAFHIQATMVTDHGYFTPAEGKISLNLSVDNRLVFSILDVPHFIVKDANGILTLLMNYGKVH